MASGASGGLSRQTHAGAYLGNLYTGETMLLNVGRQSTLIAPCRRAPNHPRVMLCTAAAITWAVSPSLLRAAPQSDPGCPQAGVPYNRRTPRITE